ncbi:MAG TPA: CehA/McbA family metallohydrolase [Candidatus Aminicenantes bacterium]|nr:CehA/McbA family metallohydrolase [Candidatus Aminicenantes bacterium]HPB55681.1 CehA/McbA family metallohydrolase [Candidatus Aminicenantes bacterium]HPS99305.1 CehA/McbA family metallohydrolase [Candidatus Aminicenantes bacterium]
MKRSFFLILLFLSFSLSGQEASKWYKGNLHTHTNLSDGNETPRRVVRWYYDHDYNFLFITDHNSLTEVARLDVDPRDDFLVLPGEEITNSLAKQRLHTIALFATTPVMPSKGKSSVEILQKDIDNALATSALVQLNHPLWRWSLTSSEIGQLKGLTLMEIINYNRDSNNFPAGGSRGTEGLWDDLLSKGFQIYGTASDDTHDYLGEFLPSLSYPGKGWIMVRAEELSPQAIRKSLERGDFYLSTGVTLEDVSATQRLYSLKIQARDDEKYTTLFIGKDGKVLREDLSLTPSYAPEGGETYVRAKVISSNGETAMTQPLFLKRP